MLILVFFFKYVVLNSQRLKNIYKKTALSIIEYASLLPYFNYILITTNAFFLNSKQKL